VANLTAPTWPIYRAGVDQDDEIQQIGGQRVTDDNDVAVVLQRHRPGDQVTIVFKDRTGTPKTATLTLGEDPHIEVAVSEPTPAQRAFRDRWLGSR
jgi:S1-C subfamily serine protease